jgi:arylsulfatase
MRKRNILFIMTDEHRWDYMGYMDHPVLQTPNFDRLAKQGAVFTHCYSPNPLCMPARNAIHTGLYTFQSGQMNNVGDWPMGFPTFTQALQSLGYHTALVGKLHAHEAVGYDIDLTEDPWAAEIHALGFDDVIQVAGKTMDFFTDDHYTHYLRDRDLLYAYRADIVRRVEDPGPTRGAWASILPEEDYIDNFIGRNAAEWLQRYDDDRPFFLMASFCSPHPCYDAHQRALDRVDPSMVPLPVANEQAESYRQMVANYIAQIEIVDENVGRILKVLEERGWLDDTLIVFTADHGEMLGDGGKHSKCTWEDASTRVPMLVSYPERTEQSVVSDMLVSVHDVSATMLDWAAGEEAWPRYLPGCSAVSVRPFLTGEASGVRDVVFSENGGQFGRPWRMMDDGRWKYVRLLDTGEELVFDKLHDPHCLSNQASDPAMEGVMARLREAMLRTYEEHPSPKTGRAAYSPLTSHRITRERLERYRAEGRH